MRDFLTAAFLNFAGPVTLLAFLLWAYFVREVAGKWERAHSVSALWALGATAIAFLSTNVDLKVLSDETNLLSVANMLALFGKASNTEMWTYYYHTFHALDVSVPSRPILFPLLTALVHGLGGMKPWSPFVVNFLGLAGLVFLVIEWGRSRLPQWGRALTTLSLLMSPVLLIVATSAGYDLCSLFFGFVAFLLLQRYALTPTEPVLRALVFTVVCFASVRYESIVALPLLGVGVWWISRRVPYGLYAAAFFLVLPIFTQRYLTWGTFENPPDVPAFSPAHFAKYFPIFLKAFFLEGRGPYPILLHWLGLGGLAYALWRRPSRATWLTAAYGFFLLVLLLSHHFGLADHPTQVRLFLPLSFALGLLALIFVGEMRAQLDPRAVLGLFLILFFHHHQYSLHDPLSTQLTMTREVRYVRDFLAEGTINDLHVYDRPGQITALGRSAVSWKYFEDNKEALFTNLRNHLYQRLILVEKVRYNSKPEDSALVRKGYVLHPLKEYQLSPEERLRISRVDWF